MCNADLWMELDELAGLHQATWLWTKGHAGHIDNSRCDWLAQNAAGTQTSCWPDGRRHAPLRLNLGPGYIPPRPQGGLFDDLEAPEDGDDASDPGKRRRRAWVISKCCLSLKFPEFVKTDSELS